MASNISTTEVKMIDDVLAKQCQHGQSVATIDFITDTVMECPGDIDSIDDIISVDDYFQPSGKHICELEDASKLFKNDLLLVSQLNGDGNQTQSSRKLVFWKFKQQLLSDLAAGLHLRSMAYEDKNRWASTKHNHNGEFNRVEWHPNDEYASGDVSCIGMIHLSTETLTATDVSSNPPSSSTIDVQDLSVNIPKIEVGFPGEPLVGTLRFISTRCLQYLISANALNIEADQINVNPYDQDHNILSSFDGWVFPNGSQFFNYNGQLSDAALVFAGDSHAESFTVPTLSSFFQGCCCASEHTSAEIPQTIGLASHQHSLDTLKLSCDLEVDREKSKVYSTYGCNGKEYVHTGKEDSTSMSASVEAKFGSSITLNGLSTDEVGSSTDEQYWPTHNLVPVMVFIGGVSPKYYASL